METQVHNKVLSGKKVAVLLETEYIASEVDLLTYLWGAKSRILVSDVTEPNIMPATITVTLEKLSFYMQSSSYHTSPREYHAMVSFYINLDGEITDCHV